MTDVHSQMSRRWLAVWLPFLPADALRRLEKERTGETPDRSLLVLTEKVKGAVRLAAVSQEAMQAGLTPGLTLADSRARIPDIVAVEHDPGADARMLVRLADDCERFSPTVAIDEPDGLLLDITGCEHLFGGEAQLRTALGKRLKRFGFQARATIAGTPDAARAMARHGRLAIVSPGDDEAETRRLSIAALNLSEETRVALVRAGLKTVGALASRPTLPLSARFSEDIAGRMRRMFGTEGTPVTARRIVPMCMTERRFAEPIARVEDIEATLSDLIAEAADLLSQRREGGRIFEGSFFRADGAVRRIDVETGRPTRDVKAVMRLYRERLDALADPIDPGFGFDMIRLAVLVAEPMSPAQTSLDGRVAEEGEIAELVDRLSARFGRERVLRFVSVDTHDPDRAVKAMPAVDAVSGAVSGIVWEQAEADEPPLRPIQLFDPPQAIMTVAEIPDQPPKSFTWRHVEHEVALAEGPERIAPEWWRHPDELTRDYFRVEDKNGRRFWLFRAGLYGEVEAPRWFMHGLFP